MLYHDFGFDLTRFPCHQLVAGSRISAERLWTFEALVSESPSDLKDEPALRVHENS